MDKERKELVHPIRTLLDKNNRTALAELLGKQRSSDIAEVVEILDNDQRRVVYDLLNEEVCAEVLEKIDEASRAESYNLLSDKELTVLFTLLDPDDAADLLAELPEDKREKVLNNISPKESAKIEKLMSYSEDSAGGIMDPLLISVNENSTVAEAVKKIRDAEIDEDFYCIYVVDDEGKFLGDVRIRLLLTTKEDAKISTFINPNTIYVSTDSDQEEVRNIFSKNDLIVVPVLDKNHRLAGRITADRIIEVAEEEAAEDLYAMAGTNPQELDDVSVLHAARVRMTWLLPCLIGTGITASIMMFFENNNTVVYLAAAAFVPMIAAISGNAGLQTSAIVVSGLATGHLAALKVSQVFTREIRIAMLVAISCGIIGGIACSLLLNAKAECAAGNPLRLVMAFTTAMSCSIMVSTTLGLFLPFLFKRIGIDPAISSGPLVTTANDSISVAIYMTLALLLIG